METTQIENILFRPLKVTANKETEIGYELEPISRTFTLDKERISWDWPRVKNFHTDIKEAQKTGLKYPIISGSQTDKLVEELFVKFFGEGYIGGNLSIKFIGIVELNERITARGIVRNKIIEGDNIRLVLDVWCENSKGEKVIVGTASGLVK